MNRTQFYATQRPLVERLANIARQYEEAQRTRLSYLHAVISAIAFNVSNSEAIMILKEHGMWEALSEFDSVLAEYMREHPRRTFAL